MKNKLLLIILDGVPYRNFRRLFGNLEGWVDSGEARVWTQRAVLPSICATIKLAFSIGDMLSASASFCSIRSASSMIALPLSLSPSSEMFRMRKVFRIRRTSA